MRCPFPGMDPWLEHPTLWPDVHNRLIAAMADALAPKVAPRYYVGLEQRTYLIRADDIALIKIPDLSVIPTGSYGAMEAVAEPSEAAVGVLDVDVLMRSEVEETFLEVHEVGTERLVTLIELLSPANKIGQAGRDQYEQKREHIFTTRTNFVEIDLLRAGRPMPLNSRRGGEGDYRILIARGATRPAAKLHTFGLRQPIPTIPIPLLPGEDEPTLDLNEILHALYDRARFDLRLRYDQPPIPPLVKADAEWAEGFAGDSREQIPDSRS